MTSHTRGAGVKGGMLALAAAGAVAASSAAWACTPIMGIGSVTGVKTTDTGLQAGPRGSTVVLTTERLKSRTPRSQVPNEPLASPATFRILFYDRAKLASQGDQCMCWRSLKIAFCDHRKSRSTIIESRVLRSATPAVAW